MLNKNDNLASFPRMPCSKTRNDLDFLSFFVSNSWSSICTNVARTNPEINYLLELMDYYPFRYQKVSVLRLKIENGFNSTI